jgi:RNA methyltransferase, TrmH family
VSSGVGSGPIRVPSGPSVSAIAADLIATFDRARRDPALVVLEGFHALKHALRFHAAIELVAAVDAQALEGLAAELAPDLAGRFREAALGIDRPTLARLARHVPHTGVVAIARRPRVDAAQVLASPRDAPVVLLEDPRNLGNVGAVVRAAAAADAAGVLTTGAADPWDPAALRGSAGLHFALPVARVATPHRAGRPLVALHPDGDPYDPARLPPRAVLAFGSERRGLGPDLLAQADARISIPMRPGVSSLNLATSVAAVLFAARLAR